jgi:hypothetical protein
MRLAAPVFYRPAGPAFLHHRRATVNVSAGGMRVYSDDRLAVGTPLDLELVLGGGATVRCWARVVWIDELSAPSAAAYEIGLEFTDMADADRALLGEALRQP